VLVVEDEAPVRDFLRRWLDPWGYLALTAASASEALEIMLIGPADIVLTDIKMPGRDGLWLAERIHQKWPRTAIIMATGATEVETVMKSKAIGAVDYVLKPFGREMLRQALERAEANFFRIDTDW
jgi:CheY-like chemotaxis protein